MNIKFTEFNSGTNWTKGLVNDGEYFFEAKVFDEPSRFGIDEGRVSKLAICYGDKWNGFDDCFVNYDRGWDIEPDTDDEILVLSKVLDFLENAPRLQV